ncbi:hypothetical protein [Herpetosiphon sp. NSE202]|uniref:hypothetical protein n=1 Tax=Herpetosiphon sp. NSE202 TaxID=3351349 RepID=UPI00362A3F13
MWFQRVLLWLAVLGFAILVLAVGSSFLAVGAAFLAACFTALLLILYFWPIIGAVISWKIMGLFHQPEKRQHYWGLGLLGFIYGVGFILLAIDDLWLLGDWVLLGNGIGLILRSVLVEWRVAEGRVRRLSINLLLALGLPLTVTGFLWFLA